MPTIPAQLRPHPDAVFAEMGESEGVLLNLKSHAYFSLNRTGVFIWRHLAEGTASTEDALVKQMVRAFQVEPERAREDIRALIEQMLDAKLLIPGEGP